MKSGEITIITLAIVAVCCGVLGSVFSHGIKTRSITVEVHSYAGTNSTNIITIQDQKIEVSGSGGVSVPVKLK